MCPGCGQKPARGSSQGQLCRQTFDLLDFTARGLFLIVLGSSSSREQTGTRPCCLKLLRRESLLSFLAKIKYSI